MSKQTLNFETFSKLDKFKLSNPNEKLPKSKGALIYANGRFSKCKTYVFSQTVARHRASMQKFFNELKFARQVDYSLPFFLWIIIAKWFEKCLLDSSLDLATAGGERKKKDKKRFWI